MAGMLRLALLGCGDVAQIHHLPSLARLPEISVLAAADPVPEARAAALHHFPAARAFADWREAVSVPGLDAVLICLPPALHAEATEAAAEIGLHAYVEKPLATSLTEADRVLARTHGAGVIGMMGFNYRFNALYSEARRLLESGRLGALIGARTVFTLSRADLPEWKRERKEGGGVLPDLGSHHVDLARWLLQDEVVEVHATLRSRLSEDDTAIVELRLAGGLLVQSLFAYGTVDEERFEVYGDGGRLVVDRRRHQRALIEAPGERRLRRIARSARDNAHVRYILEKRSAPGHEPSHGRALRCFAAAVAARRAVQPDLQDGRVSVAVMDAAERSASSGRPERVVPAAASRLSVTGAGS
jgi:predicted dehydrogenase